MVIGNMEDIELKFQRIRLAEPHELIIQSETYCELVEIFVDGIKDEETKLNVKKYLEDAKANGSIAVFADLASLLKLPNECVDLLWDLFQILHDHGLSSNNNNNLSELKSMINMLKIRWYAEKNKTVELFKWFESFNFSNDEIISISKVVLFNNHVIYLKNLVILFYVLLKYFMRNSVYQT